jgi:hypothetical protein
MIYFVVEEVLVDNFFLHFVVRRVRGGIMFL